MSGPGPRIAVLGVALVIVTWGVASWPFTVDDAFIVGRYAQRLAQGLGYSYNDGVRSDGVTGPLALLPGLVGTLMGVDAVVSAKATGLLASAFAGSLVVHRSFRASRQEGWVTAALVCLGHNLATWATAGLGTGLATLAMSALALPLISECKRQPLAVRGMAFAGALCIAWLRPELVAAAAVLCTAHALQSSGDRVARALPALGLAVSVVSVVLFRIVLFESMMPLSASAKPPELDHGVEYIGRVLWLTTSGVGATVILAAAWRGPVRGLALALVTHAAAIALAGGDWMPGARLWVPVAPIAAAVVAAQLLRDGSMLSARGWAWRFAVIALTAIAPTMDAFVSLPQIRAAGQTREAHGVPLMNWLDRRAQRVAAVDIGLLGYNNSLAIIDLAGLTDPEVAQLSGGHLSKEIDPGWLAAQRPDALLLHSWIRPEVSDSGALVRFWGNPVENRVARMGWVRDEMRVIRVVEYAPAYWYVVLMRGAPNR